MGKVIDLIEISEIEHGSAIEKVILQEGMCDNRKTAAEIIHDKADGKHPTIGLTTWKASLDGKILKSDIKIAKNYFNAKSLAGLTGLLRGVQR